jgi:outer membrane lipoprotein-sorting protein
MKFRFISSVIVMFIMTFLLTACGDKVNEDTSTISETTSAEDTITDTLDDSNTINDSSTISKEEVEVSADDTVQASEAATTSEEDKGDIDVSLFDRALLESISFKLPDSYKTIANQTDGSDESETKSIITTYMKDRSTREESLRDDGTYIILYDANEGATYEWMEGETFGTKYMDDEYDIDAMEEELANEGMTLMDIFDQDSDFPSDEIAIKASSDKYIGRDVIIIRYEALEMSEDADAQGELSIWLDKEYSIPLKTIFDYGSTWRSITEVTEVEFNLKLDDALFIPPSNVTFEEY